MLQPGAMSQRRPTRRSLALNVARMKAGVGCGFGFWAAGLGLLSSSEVAVFFFFFPGPRPAFRTHQNPPPQPTGVFETQTSSLRTKARRRWAVRCCGTPGARWLASRFQKCRELWGCFASRLWVDISYEAQPGLTTLPPSTERPVSGSRSEAFWGFLGFLGFL